MYYPMWLGPILPRQAIQEMMMSYHALVNLTMSWFINKSAIIIQSRLGNIVMNMMNNVLYPAVSQQTTSLYLL